MNYDNLQGELDRDLFEQIDWSMLDPIIEQAVLSQEPAIRSQLLATMDEDGNLEYELQPFDRFGWTTLHVGPAKVAAIHWTQLVPGAEPDSTVIPSSGL